MIVFQLVGQPSGHERCGDRLGRCARDAMERELIAQRAHRAREPGTLDASAFEHEICCLHESPF
jgi:hypothetical protein